MSQARRSSSATPSLVTCPQFDILHRLRHRLHFCPQCSVAGNLKVDLSAKLPPRGKLCSDALLLHLPDRSM